MRGRRAAHRFNGVFDLNRAGLLDNQRALDAPALLERRLQVHEHDVVAARLELDSLARLDLETAGNPAHRHHAVLGFHLVNLEAAGARKRAADQPVGRRARVGDLEIAASNRSPFGRCAGPGMVDLERADRVIVGQRSARGNAGGGDDKGTDQVFHARSI